MSNRKSILVTGSNGLLGQKLTKLIVDKEEYNLIATGKGPNRLSWTEGYSYVSLDITNKEDVDRVFAEHKPDYVIHGAAMTNVDTCETDRDACTALNIDAVKYITAACEKHKSHLVALSTDFIFDGLNGPYKEEDTANPVSFYGECKLLGEQVVEASSCKWAIARTVLVYGITEKMSRSNIILWVKNSLESQKEIHVVTDQWRTPTLAEDLAMGCYLIVQKNATGIFNISGSDFLTPYEMAIQTADYFQLDKSLIHATDGSKFQQTAKRPPKTGFILDKAHTELGYKPHSFKEGIAVLQSQLQHNQA